MTEPLNNTSMVAVTYHPKQWLKIAQTYSLTGLKVTNQVGFTG